MSADAPAVKNGGVCRFCLKTLPGSAIGRHLESCKERRQKSAAEVATANKLERIFHIRLQSGRQFWLHIEMKASSELSDLDRFLRDIWLECCGHLSAFRILGVSYMPSHAHRQMDVSSMDVPLGKVLAIKDWFDYEYDFGSTTHIEGQVVSEREGTLEAGAAILARNSIPHVVCAECKGPPTRFCIGCDGFFCERCLEDHECGDERALPVVNSPRMGVCGYTGEGDTDSFDREDSHGG